jgi:hypothetical protein
MSEVGEGPLPLSLCAAFRVVPSSARRASKQTGNTNLLFECTRIDGSTAYLRVTPTSLRSQTQVTCLY